VNTAVVCEFSINPTRLQYSKKLPNGVAQIRPFETTVKMQNVLTFGALIPYACTDQDKIWLGE